MFQEGTTTHPRPTKHKNGKSSMVTLRMVVSNACRNDFEIESFVRSNSMSLSRCEPSNGRPETRTPLPGHKDSAFFSRRNGTTGGYDLPSHLG